MTPHNYNVLFLAAIVLFLVTAVWNWYRGEKDVFSLGAACLAGALYLVVN